MNHPENDAEKLPLDDNWLDAGGVRGAVLDMTVDTTPIFEPPSEPAQPPHPSDDDAADEQ